MSDNIRYLVPPGMRWCYITGELRKDTPEENVRQRWARSLVEEYGYPKSDLGIEFSIRMGRAPKRIDLVIFRHGAEHTQREIAIAIECKRDDKEPSDGKDGEGQLLSYMAACPVCRFGLWVGKERRAFAKEADGSIESVTDIPRFGLEEPEAPTHDDLVPANELTSVLRRCHNYIFANGLHQDQAFHELVKLIFCKIFDEEESEESLSFVVHRRERKSESGQRRLLEKRLNPLFQKVKRKYPFIFDGSDSIKLAPHVTAYIVSELQGYSLTDTDTDVKGSAYEKLVSTNLRSDHGEYFTPRNVCRMAVEMVMALYKPTELTQLTVIDCCCGTGGFLVVWLNLLYERILEQEKRRGRSSPEMRARDRVRLACQNHLFGLDIVSFLVRTCQMNMVLHGDGSSNVFEANALKSPGEWSDEVRQRVPFGKADVVLTNPPFGGKGARIDDMHILSQYELPVWRRDNTAMSFNLERLFVERALNFCKPGGHVAIILPNGILNNPSDRDIRSWLLHRAKLIATVDLPKTTFNASGGVPNSSLIIVQKFGEKEVKNASKGILDQDYEIFCAAPQTSGFTGKGRKYKSVWVKHPDGRLLLDDEGYRVKDDEIATVAEQFKSWLASSKA